MELDAIIRALRDSRLCADVPAEQLAAMAQDMRAQPFEAGQTLASPGDRVTEFRLIAEGEVEGFLADTHGREKLIGVLHAGDTIAEVAILEKTPVAIRFNARSNGVLLCTSAEKFCAWLDAYPQLMRNMFSALSSKFKRVLGIEDRRLPSPRLGIVAPSPRGRLLAARLVARLTDIGERVHVWSDNPAQLQTVGGWPESIPVHEVQPSEQPLLEAPMPGIDRRVVVWTPGLEVASDSRRLQSCDELLWMLEPREAVATNQDVRRLVSDTSSLADKVRVVWLLDRDAPVAPIVSGWQWSHPPVKVHVETTSGEMTRLERQGLGRLVRVCRGFKLGIALAGGGAKGMAHFGVLKVLEEAGLYFDVMSGTSAGAMAGILYASGMSPDAAVENFQRDLTPPRIVKFMPKWPNWYLVSQYRRRAWDAKLRRYLHDWRLEQLPIPFHAITVDLVQVQPVARSTGDAVHAILESINLPVVSPPILRDGKVLVDGGILNNLPADVLVERGADFVIGVDVSSRIRPEFAGNRPDLPTNKMRPASMLDTLFRIFEAQAHNIGSVRNKAVDFWITPDTSGFGLAEFHRTAEIAAAGELAARSKLVELTQTLDQIKERMIKTSNLVQK